MIHELDQRFNTKDFRCYQIKSFKSIEVLLFHNGLPLKRTTHIKYSLESKPQTVCAELLVVDGRTLTWLYCEFFQIEKGPKLYPFGVFDLKLT